MNKNIKERIFKWSCKKNKMCDVWYIVKWGVKIFTIVDENALTEQGVLSFLFFFYGTRC